VRKSDLYQPLMLLAGAMSLVIIGRAVQLAAGGSWRQALFAGAFGLFILLLVVSGFLRAAPRIRAMRLDARGRAAILWYAFGIGGAALLAGTCVGMVDGTPGGVVALAVMTVCGLSVGRFYWNEATRDSSTGRDRMPDED